MMKRLYFFFFFLPVLLSAQSHPIAVIDPPPGGHPPAGRHTNQLVIYTNALERDRTGTNEYGLEASVINNVVVELGGNDSLIPVNGYVVSGHGTAATWIGNYLTPGTAISRDENEVRVDDSPDARAWSLMYKLGEFEKNISADSSEGTVAALSVPLLREELQKALDNGDYGELEKLEEAFERIVEIEWKGELKGIPSVEGEIRGAWHRLKETTADEIAQLADELSSAGINVLFPETIYGSQAIYEDPTGLYPKFEQFGEIDALKVLIDECHARGIEVHAWVHNFFIGVEGNEEEPALLAKKYPNWLAMDRKGRGKAVHEPNYVYLNPAHPEVREALIEAYKELARNYDVDGFQFDYIRYSNAHYPEDWDYSEFTRNKVKKELGFDPMGINPIENSEEWQKWLDWRERQITSFVEEAGKELRAIKPDLILSADVFPELENTIVTKAQNWADWTKSGLIDAVVPMAYYRDTEPVMEAVNEVDSHTANATSPVGLAPFLNISARQLVNQIIATRETGAEGQVLFSWDTTTPEMREALSLGPWKTKTKPKWE